MPFVGIELTTYRLQGGCSTTELKRRNLILLDDLEMAYLALRRSSRFLNCFGGFRCLGIIRGLIRRLRGGGIKLWLETHAVTGFFRKDSDHCRERHSDFLRGTVEARVEQRPLVVHRELVRRQRANVENDFTVFNERGWHARQSVYADREVGRVALFDAPFVQCANEKRFSGLFAQDD